MHIYFMIIIFNFMILIYNFVYIFKYVNIYYLTILLSLSLSKNSRKTSRLSEPIERQKNIVTTQNTFKDIEILLMRSISSLPLGTSRFIGAREIAPIIPCIIEGREGVVPPDTATFLRPGDSDRESGPRQNTILHRRREPSSRSRKITREKNQNQKKKKKKNRAQERRDVIDSRARARSTFLRRLWVTFPRGGRGERGRSVENGQREKEY